MIPFITTDEEKRHLPPGERCGYIIHRFAIQISIQERTVKRRAFDDSQRFAGTSRRPLHDRPGIFQDCGELKGDQRFILEIGRASCRESVWPYVEIWGDGVQIKKKKNN